MGRRSQRVVACAIALAVGSSLVALDAVDPPRAVAAPVDSRFEDEVVLSGLDHPTTLDFAPDGRVFVAEQSGLVKVFDNLQDPSATVFADLRVAVHNWWDRGLLGMTLDPDFPARPYVYVQYTHNAPVGGVAPAWPSSDGTADECPTPPGATDDGCVVSGRLARLTVSNGGSGDTMVPGSELVLVEDWCQQYPSHSIGGLVFGPDGMLYAGGGDGASFSRVDYGQDGSPSNPCGDPPGGVGANLTPPTAEGGALRSQDLLTSGDPTGLDGSIVRVDPDTGDPVPGNPRFGEPGADENAQRIIATGMRNPLRFTFRPGTDEMYVGDVGWNDWEEINLISDANDSVLENFGWPCYEGSGRQGGYESAGLDLCDSIYVPFGQPLPVDEPLYSYIHWDTVVPGESCPQGSSAIAGLAFEEGNDFPSDYDGALFFTDYNRACIWSIRAGASGQPDPSQVDTFATLPGGAVDLKFGPDGALYWVDLIAGQIHRIRSTTNQTPTADIAADRTWGDLPLTVNFDGTASDDPDGAIVSYEWDLDGDGSYDDSGSPTPSYTYTTQGFVTVGLRVTDDGGASGTTSMLIAPGDAPPEVTISDPDDSLTWAVGDQISFSGSADDAVDGQLPASALTWTVNIIVCEEGGGCSTRFVESFPGVDSGSFFAPDWIDASFLEVILEATDQTGLTAEERVLLTPRTTTLNVRSQPSGLKLGVGSAQVTTPYSTTVIEGSENNVSAPAKQDLDDVAYLFASWSDGGDATHSIIAPPGALTLTATYEQAPPPLLPDPSEGGWTLNGSAVLSGSELVLTPAAPDSAGSAFWPDDSIPTAELDVGFDVVIGPGTGADGTALIFADPGVSPTSLGAAGGGLGFAGISGVAVALDTNQNGADPSDNFVGIATGGTPAELPYVATATNVPDLTGAHHVDVSVDAGRFRVSVDGVQVLDETVPLSSTTMIGFSAGTGGLYDRHAVSNVVVTTRTAPPPVPKVMPRDGSVVEGDSGSRTLRVPVRLSAASDEVVTVDWATVDTLGQPKPGVDYEPASGTVRFSPGKTTATVPVTVFGDTVDEGDEAGSVRFSSPTNATLSTEFAAAVIVDDDDAPLPPPPPPPPKDSGDVGSTGGAECEADLGAPTYAVVDEVGAVTVFGGAHHGDPAGQLASGEVPVDIEMTGTGKGYLVITNTGRVFAYGDAGHHGDVDPAALRPGESVVSISRYLDSGYWAFTDMGMVFAFGAAPDHGNVADLPLQGGIRDSVALPDGTGYYQIATDGGVFASGKARFHGSLPGIGITPNFPIAGLVPDKCGNGYWLFSEVDGGMFTFSLTDSLPFYGSVPQHVNYWALNGPIVSAVNYGEAYLAAASDGGVFNFSELGFQGSLGAQGSPHAIASIGAAY